MKNSRLIKLLNEQFELLAEILNVLSRIALRTDDAISDLATGVFKSPLAVLIISDVNRF